MNAVNTINSDTAEDKKREETRQGQTCRGHLHEGEKYIIEQVNHTLGNTKLPLKQRDSLEHDSFYKDISAHVTAK